MTKTCAWSNCRGLRDGTGYCAAHNEVVAEQDARRKAEAAREQAIRDKRGAAVPAVLAALGVGWRLASDENADVPDRVTLRHTDGRGIDLTVNGYRHRDRIVVSGDHYGPGETETGRHWPRDAASTEITVALDTDPVRIGREVVRRLLPGYAAAWVEARAAARRARDYATARDVLAKRIAAATGDAKAQCDTDGRVWFRGGEATCHGDGAVTLTLRSLSEAQAVAALTAIREAADVAA